MSALILAHLPRAVRQQSSSSSSPLPPALPHGDCPGVRRSAASPELSLLDPAPLSKPSKCHRAVICSQVTVPGEWLPLQQTLQTPGLFQEFLHQGSRRDVSRGLWLSGASAQPALLLSSQWPPKLPAGTQESRRDELLPPNAQEKSPTEKGRKLHGCLAAFLLVSQQGMQIANASYGVGGFKGSTQGRAAQMTVRKHRNFLTCAALF